MGVIVMRYSRYGKFKFQDYWLNWIFVIMFALFGIIAIVYEVPLIYCSVYILIAILKTLCVILPHREFFEINNNTFIIYKGKKIKKVELPTRFIVIISYADICTDIAKKTSLVNRTYMLKQRYSVSFLKEMPLQELLERLHGKYGYKYTNCWIEELMKQNYLYSFICEQCNLEEVLSGKNFTLILPETLSDKINTNVLKCDLYIDKGF